LLTGVKKDHEKKDDPVRCTNTCTVKGRPEKFGKGKRAEGAEQVRKRERTKK